MEAGPSPGPLPGRAAVGFFSTVAAAGSRGEASTGPRQQPIDSDALTTRLGVFQPLGEKLKMARLP